MTIRDEIWEFALTNPDYWEVLRSDNKPDVLDQGDLEAFEAARGVVQERLIKLINACREELKLRSENNIMKRSFTKNVQRGTVLNNKVGFYLPAHRAWFGLSVERLGTDSIALYASVWVAKKRFTMAKDSLRSASPGKKNCLFYARKIVPNQDDNSQVREFVDVFWIELVAFQDGAVVPLNQEEEDEGSLEESDEEP